MKPLRPNTQPVLHTRYEWALASNPSDVCLVLKGSEKGILRPLEVMEDAQSYMRFLKVSMLTCLQAFWAGQGIVCSFVSSDGGVRSTIFALNAYKLKLG